MTLETGRRVGDMSLVALSVATEGEIVGTAQALDAAGIPPLERDRRSERSGSDGSSPWSLWR